MYSPLKGLLKNCGKIVQCLMPTIIESSWPQLTSARTRFKGARMRRDYKRRKLVEQFYNERMRLNCVRRNTILPPEIKELADKEVYGYPRDACYTRINKRCIITSRPRGLLNRWRVSRFVWRHQSDYNYMSGVMRASW